MKKRARMTTDEHKYDSVWQLVTQALFNVVIDAFIVAFLDYASFL